MEPPRGGRRPSGARESQLFLGYDSPPPRGASGPVPGRAPLHAPRSPSWARHPFIRRHVIGLLCGWDVAPPRRRGRPSGARESQVFFGGVITKIFSKIQNDMSTTTTGTTEEPCRIRTYYKGQTPENDISPSYRATRRYTKIHLGFCLRFSTLIGRIGRVPLFGAGPRRHIRSRLFRLAVTAFWRALTASWRQKSKRSRSFLGSFARQNCLQILRP